MKTKLLFVLFIIGLIQIKLNAQTNVSGVISTNTTWTIANSPYIVVGNTLVESNTLLIIEPGVEIKFNNGFYLKIQGEIKAIGSPQNKIHFTSNDLSPNPEDWENIWLVGTTVSFDNNNNYNSGSIFKNCIIEFARKGLFVDDAQIYIDSCELKNNSSGIDFRNIDNSIIINCAIYNNNNGTSISYDSWYIDNFTNVKFINNHIFQNINTGLQFGGYKVNSSGNLFSNNHIQDNGTWGMFFGTGDVVSGFNDNIIKNNKIVNNSYGGIYISDANNTIAENYIYANGYGISTDHGDNNLTIENNIILNNKIGILLQRSWWGGTINSNQFYDNIESIEIREYCCGYYPRNFSIGNNTFSHNSDSSLIEIGIGDNISLNSNNFNVNNLIIKNLTANDILSDNNYWNQQDDSNIDLKIIDYYDNFEFGKVVYSPILTVPDIIAPISSPINFYKSSTTNGVSLTWTPNQESDIAGYKIYYNQIDEFSYANSIDVGNNTSYTINGLTLSDKFVVTAYDNQADGTDDLFEGHESWFSQPAKQHFTASLNSGNSYCVGEKIQCQVTTISDYELDNSFILQLSDTTGDFSTPTELASINTPSSTLFDIDIPTSIFYGKQYKIRVKSTNPEAYSQSFNVIFNQTPLSDFSLSSNTLCDIDTVLISYNGAFSSNATYNWSFDGGNIISGNDQNGYNVNWSSLGNKTLSLTVDENGCSSQTTSHKVDVFQIPTSDFNMSESVCDTNTVSISYNGNASNTANFSWGLSNANILSNSNNEIDIYWTTTGKDSVCLIVEENGCYSDTTFKIIDVNATPSSEFSINKVAICGADTIDAVYQGTGTTNAAYFWYLEDASIISGNDRTGYKLNWANPGQKKIHLSVIENGCISEMNSQEIEVKSIPTSTFSIPESVCDSSIVSIAYTGNASFAANYSWEIFDALQKGINSSENFDAYWKTAGIKKIKLTVEENGCFSDTTTNQISVLSTPTSSFIIENSSLCGQDTTTISYSGTAASDAIYNWDFSDGNKISGEDQTGYNVNWLSSGVKTIGLSVEENGCLSETTAQKIDVYDIPSSEFSLGNNVCGDETTIVSFNGNASANASYNWNFDGANIISGNNSGPYELSWDTNGDKILSLIIEENGCFSIETIDTIIRNEFPTATFNYPEKLCFNNNAIIGYNGSATENAVFDWSFDGGTIISGEGSGPYEITWDNSGEKNISLTVTDNNCTTSESKVLEINQETLPISICMVNVNESNNNVIIWEQLYDVQLDSVIIYKESSQADVYEKIGAINTTEQFFFIDELSNSSQNSNRYKISVLDTCGFETNQSDYHKTLHLTISTGIGGAWNLIWDGYEGVNYPTYYIYRGTSKDNLLKIAEQASNTFTFTDLTPPTGDVYYQVAIDNPNTCNENSTKSKKSNGLISSNIVSSNQLTSIENPLSKNVNIFPNPASKKLHITSTNVLRVKNIAIMSLDGKIVLEKQSNNIIKEIDISKLAKGTYILKLKSTNQIVEMKFIKQ